MKTILITAYAVNPFKGSENGMGWRFVEEASREYKVIAITRKNNLPEINRFIQEHGEEVHHNVKWVGYDLPYWARWWKKGEWLALFYYVLWQRFIVSFIRKKGLEFDLVHNLNFHNDWTPSFLWKLDAPFLWGPIGHHPPIPKAFIKPIYGFKAWFSDRLKSGIKESFRKLIPGLKKTAKKADHILAMHPGVAPKLGLAPDSWTLLPSVGTEWVAPQEHLPQDTFSLISVGRFIPLKGFDITISAFAHFYHTLTPEAQKHVELKLVGKGPSQALLEKLAEELGVSDVVKFIPWMDRSVLLEEYRKAQAFIFPSHEGAGMVVAEALSYSLPVICLDNVGPGAFIDKACGLTANYKEGYEGVVKTLGNHITTLHQQPDTRNAMAKAARQRFENTFDWKAKGAQLRAIYANLLN